MVKPTYAIIVAAGSGRRFGSPLPKQFCMLGGKPVLAHTIDKLKAALPDETKIVLVLNPDYYVLWEEIAGTFRCTREDILVPGGECRAESVANALDACDLNGNPVVMVHDGVRPFVSKEITDRLYEALEEGAACAIPSIALTDSIREKEADGSSNAVDRSRFRAVQTPQAFPADILTEAYNAARAKYGYAEFTDDASVVERTIPGAKVRLTEGSPYNIKITNPLDLKIAESLL